ncbi:MAG: putative metal-binding motif-containing protein [Byssovorax sp.]
MKSSLFFAAALAALGLAPEAWASTGICDSNPPTSTQACIDAIQNGGKVVNDIFKDANGLTGPQLPVFGKLFNQWPAACTTTNGGGCAGTSNSPWSCPGQYTCAGLPNTLANAGDFMNALDRKWWQPCRISDPSLDASGCPAFNVCTPDGTGGNYIAKNGFVFDLGGPSNKVAIFAENDHGPQPCESIEYTVYLTDNPSSNEQIQDPKTTGVDPMKWNRAVLSTIYTKGFVEIRPAQAMIDPAYAQCGDTPLYTVEEDSFVSVYALPCGITFRYASIVAGNDGLDFPACAFDSSEAELDAVAGLTESGAAVCPDSDGDHFVDCACPGAPPVCDCNDADPAVHPGAPEACDSPDLNCDKLPGACSDPKTVCYKSECLTTCGGENPICPAGAGCASTPLGNLCVPQDCTNNPCPAGGVCKNGSCVPACDTVVCPSGQVCQDGQCLDACQGVQCPSGEACKDGQCTFPCACFAGDSGCSGGNVCDKTGMPACVPPACVGSMCDTGKVCNPINGMCVDSCAGVMCPQGQVCASPGACVPICSTKTCDTGLVCNPQTGVCEDTSCANITCFPPQICKLGMCVDSPTGAGGMGGMGGAAETSTSSTGTMATGAGGAGGVQISGDKGSCGCRVAGDPDRDSLGALAALVAAAAWIRRRRSAKKGW